jgi:hypothetical protein
MVVRDKASAIRMAATECAKECEGKGHAYWFAQFSQGQWEVTFHIVGDRGSCPWFHVWVDARSGKAHDGDYCVTTD